MVSFSIQDYFQYCDQLELDWREQVSAIKTNDPFLSRSTVLAGKPYFDVMPEPFLGDPDNCSIVMINLNPGYTAEDKDDGVKADEDVLSRKAAATLCKNGYSSYAKPFPHLDDNPPHPSGAEWWKGRTDYLNRLVYQYKDIPADTIKPRPFAIELCPWHSHKWEEAKIVIDSVIYSQMQKRTLAPAFYAIRHSMVDFALAVGAAAIPVLEQNGFKLVQSFGPTKDIEGKPYPRVTDNNISFPNYPKTTKKRKGVKIGESDAEVFYKYYKKGDLKVLSVSKTGSNNTPGPDYAKLGIEKVILDFIKTH